jgi:murein DD-endopeptidase MepM/ murein hydrolase activator NlpD
MSELDETETTVPTGDRARARRLPWFTAGLTAPLLWVGLFLPDGGYQDSLRLDLTLAEINPVFTLPLLFNSADLITAGGFGDPEAGGIGHSSAVLRVRRGDTLERLFRREGLDLADLTAILQLAPARENLRLLKPGDEIKVYHDGSALVELTRHIDVFNTLSVTRADSGFAARVIAVDYDTQTSRASAEIRSSLFEAGSQAGISDSTIMKLASIFGSEIDFVLDLREGDQFTLVYEEMWHDGAKLAEGDILAAEFVNQGHRYRAIRYVDSAGRASYYTPEGRSLQRAFVRVPLAFSRVSSNFNPRRRHPILNTIRAHTGVDYAAPSGTPVRAPGDGTVIFRGRKGGYGNTIILKHPGGVTTLYAHLSGFARTLRVGQRVQQGNTIGYVGATGLATAPHLHYEYRINDRPVNPRTVKLPEARAIDPAEQSRFLQAATQLLRTLDADAPALAGVPARIAAGPPTRS